MASALRPDTLWRVACLQLVGKLKVLRATGDGDEELRLGHTPVRWSMKRASRGTEVLVATLIQWAGSSRPSNSTRPPSRQVHGSLGSGRRHYCHGRGRAASERGIRGSCAARSGSGGAHNFSATTPEIDRRCEKNAMNIRICNESVLDVYLFRLKSLMLFFFLKE